MQTLKIYIAKTEDGKYQSFELTNGVVYPVGGKYETFEKARSCAAWYFKELRQNVELVYIGSLYQFMKTI